MSELTAFFLGVVVTTIALLPYLISRRADALKRRDLKAQSNKLPVPYILRNGLEDTASFNIRMLMDIRDFLIVLENQIDQQRVLIGQIRNGRYRQDQPAAERNGRVRETYREKN